MNYNIILTLSSETGFGSRLAHIVKDNIDGITHIVPITGIRKDKTYLKNMSDHPMRKNLKIILVMPEFNGSYPAYFKEWIDNQGWPNLLENEKVFLVGYSGSFTGNTLGVNHMKAVLDYISADTYRHTSHFTYNGKNEVIYNKETEILIDLIKKFNRNE